MNWTTMPARRVRQLFRAPLSFLSNLNPLSLATKITTIMLVASFFVGVTVPLRTVTAQGHVRGPALDVNANLPDDLSNGEYREGEVLMSFQPGLARRRADETRKGIGAEKIREFKQIGVEHWRLPAGRTVEEAVATLSRNPNVKFAEPNYIVQADALPLSPNDSFRSDLWGLHNLGQTGGASDSDIDAPEAWNVTTGSSNVVIGIIDTGIDYNHPDLADNIWVNSGEIAGNNADDDENGYIDDVRGWDFANNDNDPIDDNGHGSHVAGTIGATGNNGTGVVGVNWNVKMMPLKFLGANGSGDVANAMSAVLYAASFKVGGANVVRITNNSWGGGKKSVAMQTAISNSGSLFVASAGNGATSQVQYPAGYSSTNILSVAATDHNDALATFSNFSSSWVDLAAPGVNTFSTFRSGGYRSLSGTSMASPHVAGAAGLVLAATPGVSIASLKSTLMSTVDQVSALAGKTVTGGRLNVGRAVGSSAVINDGCSTASCSPANVVDLAANPAAATATSVTLNWTATGDDGSSGNGYLSEVRYSTAPIDAGNFAQASSASGELVPPTAGSTDSFVVTGLRPGLTYHFALRVSDEVGNFSAIATTTGTTAPPEWNISIVDDPANSAGFYKSLAYNPSTGFPAIGYSAEDDNQIKFAKWNGSAWDSQIVDTTTDTGVSLAFNSANNPTLSYGWGQLRFAEYVPSTQSWQVTTLESRDASNDVTSLAYAPDGSAGISYRTTPRRGGSLKFAKRTGSGWTLQTVATAGARYSSLAYDGLGRPAIAFSDDVDADGSLDTLKLARWNGSSWSVQMVETGVVGYGVMASLAFDSAGNPAISHVVGGTVRFLTSNGSSWNVEIAANGYNSSLLLTPTGDFYVSYVESDNTMKIAHRVAPGIWESEVIDSGLPVNWIIDLATSPCGSPSAAYSANLYPNRDLRFATTCSP